MDYKKLFFASLMVCCLLLGVSGYYFMDRTSQQEMIDALSKKCEEAQEKATSEEEKARKLQSRLNLIAQTGGNTTDESKLAGIIDEKDAEITRLKKALEQASAQGGNRRGGNRGQNMRGNMKERMEKLKQENPERYEQIMSGIEKRRQEMQQRMEKREQYVCNIDTSRLSAEQKEMVSNYQNLIKTQTELRANMENGNGDFREMMDTDRQVNQLSSEIRNILIDQYAGEASEEIKNIIDATSNGGPGGPGPMGGPGGFGGGPGPR